VQRRNRKARLAHPSPLSPFDAIALTIVMSVDTLTPTVLGHYLKLPTPRVSRLLSDLAKRGLITTDRSSTDSRFKIISFTPSGEQAVRAIDQVNSRIFKDLSATISPLEQEDLLELLTGLADDMCSFNLAKRDAKAALSRLTASLGILSDNYADSGMPLSRFQILFDLWRSGGACSFSDLVAHFPLSASSLSRECDYLQAQGFVTKKTQLSDRRSTSVSITPEGSRLFLANHARIGERLMHATRFIESGQRDRGLAVLAKLAYEQGSEPADTNPLRYNSCKSVLQLQRARGFLVEELVRSRQHLALESQLLPSKHESFIVTSGDVIKGLIEFAPGSGKQWSLKRVVCEATIGRNHLKTVLRDLAKSLKLDGASVKTALILPSGLRESVQVALTTGTGRR
jgi:DNA-binding MarR family transcriptional regulator